MTLFFSAKVSINFLFPLCGLFVTIRPTIQCSPILLHGFTRDLVPRNSRSANQIQENIKYGNSFSYKYLKINSISIGIHVYACTSVAAR